MTESKTPVALIVILIIVFIILPVFLSAFLYVMVLGIGSPSPQMVIVAMTSSSTETNWVFTIAAISGGSLTKSDVYVRVFDASNICTIDTVKLTTASGTEGFSYIPINSSNNLMIGDEFRLSKSGYGIGSAIWLVSFGGSYIYGTATAY